MNRTVLALFGALLTCSCAWLPAGEDYRSAEAAAPLQVPTDLSPPLTNAALVVPAGASGVGLVESPPVLGPEATTGPVRLYGVDGELVLGLEDQPPSAFRRVLIAVERLGYTVNSSDAAALNLQLNYRLKREELAGNAFGRFFRRLTGSTPAVEIELTIRATGEGSEVRISSADSRVSPTSRDEILRQIYERLR